MAMMNKKTWEEFRTAGLLWWVNRMLHLFGWAIVIEMDNDVAIGAYPARVKFRGFSEECEKQGFINLSEYLAENRKALVEEAYLGDDEEG